MNSNEQYSVINVVDINARDVNIIVEHLQALQKKLELNYPIESVQHHDTVSDDILAIDKAIRDARYLARVLKEKIESQ